MIAKWSEKDLLDMKELNYSIIKCNSENEALEIKRVLKENKRCAQIGYIQNKQGMDIYFICTKEKKV